MIEIFSKNLGETKKTARALAKEILHSKKGRILALEGNLGSGKTSFSQGFAEALGIKEKVLSPTFVLLKIYKIPGKNFLKHFIHIDCYRVSLKETASLDLKNHFKDPRAVILIEWADRVKKIIPPDALWIKFRHGKKENERIISFLQLKS